MRPDRLRVPLSDLLSRTPYGLALGGKRPEREIERVSQFTASNTAHALTLPLLI